MKKVHFFKAYSRLGLITPPYHSIDVNIGVENAPDAILSPEFLALFNDPTITSYTFPKPEDIKKEDYQQTIAQYSKEFGNIILKSLKNDETQVTIGGDHSITLATLLTLQNRFDLSQVGYIQFDSHGDINLFASSPTGNFHGIYVRPFVDQLDSKVINSLVKTRLSPKNILYIGNLDLDFEEKDFMAKKNITTYSRQDILDKNDLVKKTVENIIKNTQHIHVSFDVDVFDHTLVKATGIPAASGLFLEDMISFLKILANSPSLSVDLVEINPQKEGAQKSIGIARKVLIELLH